MQIVKETEDEKIIKFELTPHYNFWMIKSKSDEYGFGYTQKSAYKNQQKQFANEGVPPFITRLGSTSKTNNKSVVNSVPAAVKFIQPLIPKEWESWFVFRVIVDQSVGATFLEVAAASEDDLAPYRFWSDDVRGTHQQITNCIYEFYKKYEQTDFEMDIQHKKLGEWQRNWYNKLQPRRLE